jgi:hypothetical protein
VHIEPENTGVCAGFTRMLATPIVRIRAPYERWQQEGADLRNERAQSEAERRGAADRLRGAHIQLWTRWHELLGEALINLEEDPK